MKRILYSLLFTALFIPASCSLDIDPTDRYSAATVWSSESSIDQYVFGFYGFLRESIEPNPSMSGYRNDCACFTDAYSDIIKSTSWDQYGHSFNRALLEESLFTSSDAGPLDCWSGDSGCYNRIRRQNEFLRDAPNYVDKFGQDFINIRMAEVRFIRAFAYYRLIRVYGGVVLRTSVDGPEQNDKPRSSEADSWQQVIDDLKFAYEFLPDTWGGNGRLTKAAAYAMLSRVGLYAKQWDQVIFAADKCKEYGAQLSLGEDGYAKVFSDASNPENIFVVNFKSAEVTHKADQFFRPSGDKASHGGATVTSAFCPTSELVDSYEMADGTPFSWETHGKDPYTGREPRFYASILYNGADWEGRKIETFVGGADGFLEFQASTGAPESTVTGYYLRKWITEGDNTWKTNGSSHFYALLRYSEVLLNKAEALAEQDWNANKTAALAALNEVRSRVNLPARDASTKEEFMEYLRHERMVELAGEGFRYWDLRRWRLAVDVIHGSTAHGVKITKNEETGELKYEQVEVDGGKTRIFLDKFYAFSIPIVERSNNKLLGENNPGW